LNSEDAISRGSPSGAAVRGNSMAFRVGIVNWDRPPEIMAVSPAISTVTLPDGITRTMSLSIRALTRP